MNHTRLKYAINRLLELDEELELLDELEEELHEELELEDEQLESIILEGIAQFKRIKSIIQKNDDDVMAVLTKYEPFNDEAIAARIKEIIANENA